MSVQQRHHTAINIFIRMRCLLGRPSPRSPFSERWRPGPDAPVNLRARATAVPDSGAYSPFVTSAERNVLTGYRRVTNTHDALIEGFARERAVSRRRRVRVPIR